jgi:hypothetical protein
MEPPEDSVALNQTPVLDWANQNLGLGEPFRLDPITFYIATQTQEWPATAYNCSSFRQVPVPAAVVSLATPAGHTFSKVASAECGHGVLGCALGESR